MRRLSRWFLLFALPAAVCMAANACSAPPASPAAMQADAATRPAQIDTATTQMSQQGLYRISYSTELDPITINTLHTWTVQVATPDGQPVADAEVSVAGGMPEHNHGMPTQPQVTPIGGGDYRVEGMKFQMPGWWTVTVVVASGDQQDSATFNLLLD